MSDLTIREINNSREYGSPKGNNHRRTPGVVHVGSESKEHAIAKEAICRYLESEGHRFITEAIRVDNKRRVDIVDLTTGEEIEVETDPKRAERFKNVDEVTVIPVGWPEKALEAWRINNEY